MGPEEGNEFELGVGRVFMVPLGPDGEPMAGTEVPVTAMEFGWGEDSGWGDDLGLDGGLRGGPDGALVQTGPLSYSMELEFTSEEFSYPLMAILMGKTEEELRDLVQWARELEWLEAVTGLNWGRFE